MSGRSGGSDRGQSNVVGTVLILGMALTGAALVVALGGMALDDVRTAVDVEDATGSMREVGSRLSQVAYGNNDVETLSFGAGERQRVRVEPDSYVNLTVNGTADCRVHVGMGALVQSVENGPDVAYEGGGIWRQYANASVMASPPDLQYRNGTLNFPVVDVSGGVNGSVDGLRATKNVSRSQERSRELREMLNEEACRPPGNASLLVHSDYYDAWAGYFREEIGGNVTVDHGNETASVLVSRFGGPAAAYAGDGTLRADDDVVAEVKINGTGFHTGHSYEDGFHAPIAFEVDVEDAGTYVFGPDGIENRSLNMSYGTDDMNNPLVAHEHGVYPTDTVSVPAETNFSVVATSYVCSRYGGITHRDDGVLADTGPTLPDTAGHSDGPRRSDNVNDRCVGPNLDERVYKDLGSDEESEFLQVYNHTDNVVTDDADDSDFDDGLSYQRTPKQVLGEIYNRTDANGDGDDEIYLDLDPNQAVYLYELDSDSLSSADFNDAIVLVTLRETGNVGGDAQFVIHLSQNSVRITSN